MNNVNNRADTDSKTAFYAWTDTQLLNILNAKITLFNKEKSVLFVLMLDRVSVKLVDSIERSGVFKRVIKITPPPDFKNMHKLVRRIILLGYAHKYRSYFDNYVKDECYSRFVTAGYWSYSLFLIRAMLRNNSSLKVTVIEEGSGSYYRTLRRVCQTWPRTCTAEKITRFFYFGSFGKKAASLIDSAIAYHPELLPYDETIKRVRLPKADNKSKCLNNALSCWENDEEYKSIKREQIFFIEFPPNTERFKDLQQQLWSITASETEGAVYLRHPSLSDTRDFPFEALCENNEMSKKVLIGVGSGSLISPKFMFDSEPYVIFTHKIFENENIIHSDEWQIHADNLKKTYTASTKIYVPETVEDFKNALISIKNEIHNQCIRE